VIDSGLGHPAAEYVLQQREHLVAQPGAAEPGVGVVRVLPDRQPFRGARVASGGDHRMAMALVVAGLVADGETVVEDTACVATSFPQFVETLNGLAGGPAVTVEA